MAQAYPEGECFFRRDALSLSIPHLGQRWTYDPNNSGQFYNTCFVEHVTNQCVQHVTNPLPDRTHPRTTYRIVMGQWYLTRFGVYDMLPVTLGSLTGSSPRRLYRIPLDINGNNFRDRDAGGPAKVRLVPLIMPTETERFMWLDMVTQIRAIYFPIAQTTDQSYQHLCTYIQINFCQAGTVSIWRENTGQWAQHQTDRVNGLGAHWNQSVGIDVRGVYNLLCLPRHMRNTNVYASRLVQMTTLPSMGWPLAYTHRSDRPDWAHDFAYIVSANFGVQLVYRPYEFTSFVLNLILGLLQTGFSLIPGAGPILAFAFNVGMQVLQNPNQFAEDARKGGLAIAFIDMIINSAAGIRSNLAPAFRLADGPTGRTAGSVETDSTATDGGLEAEGQPRTLEGLKPAPEFVAALALLQEPLPVESRLGHSETEEGLVPDEEKEPESDQGLQEPLPVESPLGNSETEEGLVADAEKEPESDQGEGGAA